MTSTTADAPSAAGGGGGNILERTVRVIDGVQQRNPATAFVFGVIKKFGDDRGGMLAGLMAFYGFLSFFPLVLVIITVTSFIAQGNAHLAANINNSALKEFPVIGPQILGRSSSGVHVNPLPGSGLGLIVGLLGLVWGALGAAQAVQFALQEVWDVPNKHRPSFFTRLFRGLSFFALLGFGFLAISALTALGSIVGQSIGAGVLGVIVAGGVSILLYLCVFRLLSPRTLSWGDLLPGAVVGGIGWEVLQTVGTGLVTHQLKHASQLYGSVGLVLGLISFLSLGAQLTIYSAEINVVRYRRLWPRSIVQPPLTSSDREALRSMAKKEERRPEEHISVHFETPPLSEDPPPTPTS
jgi:YihY family inner membrane protein